MVSSMDQSTQLPHSFPVTVWEGYKVTKDSEVPGTSANLITDSLCPFYLPILPYSDTQTWSAWLTICKRRETMFTCNSSGCMGGLSLVDFMLHTGLGTGRAGEGNHLFGIILWQPQTCMTRNNRGINVTFHSDPTQPWMDAARQGKVGGSTEQQMGGDSFPMNSEDPYEDSQTSSLETEICRNLQPYLSSCGA